MVDDDGVLAWIKQVNASKMADDAEISALITKIDVWTLRPIPPMPINQPFQPGLGDFSSLPPEIRSKIWEEYFRVDSSSEHTCIPFSKRKLYDEASAALYRHRHIRLCFNCLHAENNGALTATKSDGSTFYTTVNGVCIPRNLLNADISRFQSISLLVHLPPDTDLSKICPAPKSPLIDGNLKAIWEDVTKFCELVRWCHWSKPPQHGPWPNFDIEFRLDQSAVRKPEPDRGELRFDACERFVCLVLYEITRSQFLDLENTIINVNLKVRWRDDHLKQSLCEQEQRARHGEKPHDSGQVCGGEGGSAHLHYWYQTCETAAGAPIWESKELAMVTPVGTDRDPGGGRSYRIASTI
ncbi:MAG: hypothetical protein Q9169_007716 [Polycauliona sp. 2 TL-2023]